MDGRKNGCMYTRHPKRGKGFEGISKKEEGRARRARRWRTGEKLYEGERRMRLQNNNEGT